MADGCDPACAPFISILKQQNSTGSNRRYAIVIKQAGNNYSAYVPDPLGCVAKGDTVKQAEAEIRESIAFQLDGLREDGAATPSPSSYVEYVDVAA